MIRICSYCRKIFGEKEPLEDKTKTHGICPDCFAEYEKDPDNFDEKMRKKIVLDKG